MAFGDEQDRDAAFDGLCQASGVALSDAERANLRKAFDALSSLTERVRRPGRSWSERPLSLFIPSRKTR